MEIASAVKQRDSNLELFRILTMLLIVAHHYVVNSGLTAPGGPIASSPTAGNSLFLLVFGAWGKVGINCFVMITGYFMCKSNITATKFVKLLFEILFYKIAIGFAFLLTGYQSFTISNVIRLFVPITQITCSFASAYLVFFLFIPFLNILIRNLNEKQHLYLILLCGFIYILFETIKGGPIKVDMNYVSWFCVLYIIASYIRLYPKTWHSDKRICGIGFLVSFAVAILSIIACAWIGERYDKFFPYNFVMDCNTLLAVLVGIFGFLFFKNIRLKQSRFINTVAASSFGVFLIHDNSVAMRQWLWKDTLDCVGHYGQFLYPIVCVLTVYAICTAIDFVVKNTVEKAFFKVWDSHSASLSSWWKGKEEKISEFFQLKP